MLALRTERATAPLAFSAVAAAAILPVQCYFWDLGFRGLSAVGNLGVAVFEEAGARRRAVTSVFSLAQSFALFLGGQIAEWKTVRRPARCRQRKAPERMALAEGPAPAAGGGCVGLAGTFIVVLQPGADFLDELFLAAPVENGWWIVYTTADEPPHHFEYRLLRLVVAPLGRGGWRCLVGRDRYRSVPAGLGRDWNVMCVPGAAQAWQPSGAEVAQMIAEGEAFAATIIGAGGIGSAAVALPIVPLRGGLDAMPGEPLGGAAPVRRAAWAAPGPSAADAARDPGLGGQEAGAGLALGFGGGARGSVEASPDLMSEVLRLRSMFDDFRMGGDQDKAEGRAARGRKHQEASRTRHKKNKKAGSLRDRARAAPAAGGPRLRIARRTRSPCSGTA